MNKITDKLDLLLIEDNPGDVRIIQELLHDLPEFKLFDVNSISSAFEYLDKNKTDLVLLDLGLPDSQGLDTVRKVVSQIPLMPVIVLTGFQDNEMALDSIKVGAQDYLIKGKIDADMLQRSIHHSIERKHLEIALRESEANLKALTENSKDRIWSVDRNFCLLTGNNVFYEHIRQFLGRRIETGENSLEPGMTPEGREVWRNYYNRVLNGERFNIEKEAGSTGETRYIDYAFNPIVTPEGEISGIVVSGRDITDRKEAEKELRYSFSLLNASLESTADGILIVDGKGKIIQWNQKFAGMWKLPDEVLSTHNDNATIAFILIQLKDPDGFLNKIKKLYSTPERSSFEQFEFKDGRVFERYSQPQRIGDNVVGRVWSFRDVTERKQVEEKLMESEKKYRDLFNNDLAGNFITAVNGEILLCNQAFARTFGFSSVEDALHFNVTGLYKNAEERKQLLKALHEKKKLELVEQELIRPDGKIITILLNEVGEFDENDELVRTQGYLFDITERKKAEEELKKSISLYKLLSENMRDVVWLMDLKMQTTYISSSIEKLRGYTFEEIEQMPLEKHLAPESLQIAMSVFEEEKAKLKSDINYSFNRTLELEFYRKDGSSLWLENTFSIIREENGLPVSILCEGRDITERRHIQDEMKKLNAELEQRVLDRTEQLSAMNKELEAFSYSVSHDLRAPLRAIDGFTRILFEEYEPNLDEEGKRLCAMIRENTRRMGQLIDDLLSFSRLSRIDLNISRIDMQKLASSAYDEITLPEQRQRIDFHLGEIASVHGDKTLLRQVWINLISNAIKFSSRRERVLIRISSKLEKKRVVYSIMDNGAGFDMKYVDKLFGVFQRLHSAKDFEGTGVGLAIVQHIIIRHGGQVWAEGEVDNGASFHFSLPAKALGSRH